MNHTDNIAAIDNRVVDLDAVSRALVYHKRIEHIKRIPPDNISRQKLIIRIFLF